MCLLGVHGEEKDRNDFEAEIETLAFVQHP